MANIMQMMAKAQQMKSKMQDMQERAGQMELIGEAGGGAVSVHMNGKFDVTKLTISPQTVAAGDVEIIEDLVLAAIRDARGKAEAHMASETDKIMRDLGLPPGMSLPF